MSVATPKLDYARVRNQRKSSRSIYDFKETSNSVQHDESSQNLDLQVPEAVESSTKRSSGLKKCASVRDNSDFTQLFGHNFSSGNLEYVNSLISNNNNKPEGRNKSRERSCKKISHQRAKSTLIEPPKKARPQASTDKENSGIDTTANPDTTQNAMSVPTVSGTTQASSLKPDIEYDNNMFQPELEKEDISIDKIQHKDPNNTPAEKEGKLFDQYFRKDSMRMNGLRRSMSLEDLRFEKKNGNERAEQSITESPPGFGSVMEKSSEKFQQPNTSLTGRTDFLSNINSFINYFDKSESSSQRGKQKTVNQYFVRNDGKGTQFLRKELEVAQSESKALKKLSESLQFKVTDVNKLNKHLVRELNDVRGREQGYQQRIKEMEEQFSLVKQRKKHYKMMLIKLQEQLENERADREEELATMLNKVLANVLQNYKTPSYILNGREKQSREKDQMKSIMKDLYHQKREKEAADISRFKEKKMSTGNLLHNNRYDPQVNRKLHRVKDFHKYDNSSVSHKFGTISDDEEDFTQDENNDPSFSTRNIGDDSSYQNDNYPEVYGSDNYEKKQHVKDNQAKFIHEKLMGLMERQDYNLNIDKHMNPRTTNKPKHKMSDPALPTYFALKERKTSFSKLGQPGLRYEQSKGKLRNNIENESPSSVRHNMGYSMNESDHIY